MSLMTELPPAFEGLEMTGRERHACERFLKMAQEQAPTVTIVGPRRTQSRDLKLVLEFPEGDTWGLTKTLARIANQVRRETEVYFILD